MSSFPAQIEPAQRNQPPKPPFIPEAAPTQKLEAPEPPAPEKKSPWTGLLRKIPRKAYFTALLLLAAIALFTWRFSILGETATLKLKVQHSFKSADIEVFIDGVSRYSGKVNGTTKRRFGFRHNAEGSFSHTFHLHPGSHLVRVEMKSASEGYNEINEIQMEIGPDKERLLTVTADRRRLRMAAQTAETAATQATPSWYQSYFTSLSLTISGTMISMLFGFLIQQFVDLFRKKPPDIS